MDKYTKWLENLTIGLLLLTIFTIFIDVVLRYAFNNSSITIQEMGWHLFSAMFLLGISYTLQNDAHVRVDIFYANLSVKRQAWINLIGFVIFVLPISVLIIYNGVDFSYQAFLLNEQSGDPGGLPYRFIIKGVIPLSFILLIMSGLIFVRNNLKKLKL
ncbi:TRAP transporter small permease subunit [Candidatus Ruthia endofausta]|uniref:TRAP transporter small permease protein n=1 Tax=Candidatus Ruthia endofausta TaxID=2738852 RepID=A0A6N0HMT6_9GAMM|nr:TRAP transporter small permease subunit [Candidatus Ruthia endofausta]QKQ23652.1 TRAP transporter small permease subunit [Candidatus Ruthia endofausta]